MKLSTKDLYRLRHAQLAAQRASLRAQQAEQTLRELVLELECQYGLLGTTASIDVHTGEVQMPPSNGKRSRELVDGETQGGQTLSGQNILAPSLTDEGGEP